METNLHHEFWEARNWRKYSLSKQIRDHELSKIEMIVPVHNELHRECPPVDPPSASIARMVLAILNEMPSSYGPLDAAKSLEAQLYDTEGDYLSEHLYRQMPFLELSTKAMKARRL